MRAAAAENRRRRDEDCAPTPPAKLSELLALACDAMAEMMARPGYQPHSERWHEPDEDGCHACLGGSIIAQRLGGEPDRDLVHGGQPWPWAPMLELVEAWRGGQPAELMDALRRPGAPDAPWSWASAAPAVTILRQRPRQHECVVPAGANQADAMLVWLGRAEAEAALDVLAREVRMLAEAGL